MLFAPPLEDLDKIERLIREQEQEMWCIDFQIVANIMDGVTTVEMVPEYIEDNIEYCIEK